VLVGTVTVRLKETALLLGVMVAGLKLQEAPAGNVLCRQESVMGSCEFPVLAFSAREKVADPPGDIVCGAGCCAEGPVTILSG
jgi:hypothetical protein